jgi:superfamily I DNA/RNA helicase
MIANVPYQIIGGFSFFDRLEVKDSLAMLRFAINKRDGMALSRFINKPICRIGETTLGKIENYAKQNNLTLVEAMRKAREIITTGPDRQQIYKRCELLSDVFSIDFDKLSIGDALTYLIKELNYEDF